MPKYKWDSKKWENDDEWWNPYNPKGRLKGKGTTSWARQLRRQAMQPDAQQPLEKEAEKQQELAEGKPAELPQPLEKKSKKMETRSQTSHWKNGRRRQTRLWKKKQKHQKNKEKRKMKTRQVEKMTKKQKNT